jgi:hypothetical protein
LSKIRIIITRVAKNLATFAIKMTIKLDLVLITGLKIEGKYIYQILMMRIL